MIDDRNMPSHFDGDPFDGHYHDQKQKIPQFDEARCPKLAIYVR